MSGLGGFDPQQASNEIVSTLRDILRELQLGQRAARGGMGGGATGSAAPAGSGTSGGGGRRGGSAGGGIAGGIENAIDFAGNYANKIARGAAIDAAAGVASDFAMGRGSGIVDSAFYGATQKLKSVPGAGDLLSNFQDPGQRAAGRVLGITGRAARLGLEVDPSIRSSLFETFGAQEKRAEDESAEVAKLSRTRGPGFAGDASVDTLKAFFGALEKYAQKIEQLFGGTGRQR